MFVRRRLFGALTEQVDAALILTLLCGRDTGRAAHHSEATRSVLLVDCLGRAKVTLSTMMMSVCCDASRAILRSNFDRGIPDGNIDSSVSYRASTERNDCSMEMGGTPSESMFSGTAFIRSEF